MIDIPAGFASILKKAPESPTIVELVEFIGDSFREPEVFSILQNICYRNGIDSQDFISALDDLLVKMGLNGCN